MKFIVFGLGNFGAALSQQLVNLGHEVIGVDQKQELVNKFSSTITHTIMVDATSKDAMQQLPLEHTDAAVVGIGENEGVTIMVTALLRQMGIKRIIVRVTSPLQKIVLEAMKIEEFVYPEASSADRLAFKLDLPGVINSYRFIDDYRMLEVQVPKRYIEKTIDSIRLAERYRLGLVTVVRNVIEKNIFGSENATRRVLNPVPPDLMLLPDDSLLLFGTAQDLKSFVD